MPYIAKRMAWFVMLCCSVAIFVSDSPMILCTNQVPYMIHYVLQVEVFFGKVVLCGTETLLYPYNPGLYWGFTLIDNIILGLCTDRQYYIGVLHWSTILYWGFTLIDNIILGLCTDRQYYIGALHWSTILYWGFTLIDNIIGALHWSTILYYYFYSFEVEPQSIKPSLKVNLKKTDSPRYVVFICYRLLHFQLI